MSELSDTQAAILSALHDGPKTGHELGTYTTVRLRSAVTASRAQVYRDLPMMLALGFVRLGPLGQRKTTQKYVITPAGRKAFNKWLAAPNGGDTGRSRLMLQVYFAGLLPSTQRRELLDTARRIVRRRLDEAVSAAAVAAENKNPYAEAVATCTAAIQRAAFRMIAALSRDDHPQRPGQVRR